MASNTKGPCPSSRSSAGVNPRGAFEFAGSVGREIEPVKNPVRRSRPRRKTPRTPPIVPSGADRDPCDSSQTIWTVSPPSAEPHAAPPRAPLPWFRHGRRLRRNGGVTGPHLALQQQPEPSEGPGRFRRPLIAPPAWSADHRTRRLEGTPGRRTPWRRIRRDVHVLESARRTSTGTWRRSDGLRVWFRMTQAFRCAGRRPRASTSFWFAMPRRAGLSVVCSTQAAGGFARIRSGGDRGGRNGRHFSRAAGSEATCLPWLGLVLTISSQPRGARLFALELEQPARRGANAVPSSTGSRSLTAWMRAAGPLLVSGNGLRPGLSASRGWRRWKALTEPGRLGRSARCALAGARRLGHGVLDRRSSAARTDCGPRRRSGLGRDVCDR